MVYFLKREQIVAFEAGGCMDILTGHDKVSRSNIDRLEIAFRDTKYTSVVMVLEGRL